MRFWKFVEGLREFVRGVVTIDEMGGSFRKRFRDLWEILEANGELMGDCGNKGVAVARLSQTNPHIPPPSKINLNTSKINLNILQESWTYPISPRENTKGPAASLMNEHSSLNNPSHPGLILLV